MPSRTLVLAEPGCTHEGDKAAIIRLIETAAACGADVFKPQWTSNPQKMCERRHIGPDHPKRIYYERAYSWLAFPLEWHAEFSAKVRELGMQYAVTVFLPEDIGEVFQYVDAIKIASFESGDEEMIRTVPHGVMTIISTGMMSEREAFEQRGWLGKTLVLHCVSAYPAPLAEMNLSAVRHFDGLSDHSRNMLTGAVAVGAGAKVIEAHFRLDDCDPTNPDYAVSFAPAEFKTYIDHIRTAEVMMGDGVKRIQECEEWALPYRVTG